MTATEIVTTGALSPVQSRMALIVVALLPSAPEIQSAGTETLNQESSAMTATEIVMMGALSLAESRMAFFVLDLLHHAVSSQSVVMD